ncbi:O-antigen ligase family protein [Kushneria marisflavi]|uniref:O-antigen ligase-related domain-containing protein n=1 Tax=Kushneria marisflavi TaxID=157779 RepID=A0A240USD8_9GAMM|nr:O-antigen ligase family protein [Kushneria marisflavi]ART63939.1 hypothetical protein B9H00_13480 [Kushneria marisflavi]RKD85661.1 O-antigen ligase [Kushneria marisflavi]
MIASLPPVPAWNHNAATRWCHRIGVVALLLYMFTWVLNLEVTRAFESLLVPLYLVALLSQPGRARAFSDPLWILLALWLALQLVTLPAAIQMFPEYARDEVRSMRQLSKVFMILPIAWFMAGNPRIALWTLTALILGMVLGAIFTGQDMETLLRFVQEGKRPTLGFKNWQHAGVCAGGILIAQACFVWRFFQESAGYQLVLKWLARLGFAAVALLSLFAWAITMTRASWLGVIVVALLAMAGLVVMILRGHIQSRRMLRQILLSSIVLAVLAVTLGALYGDQVAARVFKEHDVILEVLQGDLRNVPFSSIGFRIHAWHYGLQLVAEQPWFGWGPKSHIPLLLQSTNPVGDTTLGAIADTYNLRHFHNSMMSLLIANGVLGLAVWIALTITVGLSAWKSWRRGDMPNDMAVFVALFFVFWFIVNLFESYVNYRTGVYWIGAVGGMAYTFGMRRRLARHIQPSSDSLYR